MNRFLLLIVLIWLVWPQCIPAKIYRYVDSDGYQRFTNDFSMIPADKRHEATVVHEEIQTDDSIPPARQPEPSFRPRPAGSESPKKQHLEKREALQEEYDTLLKAKEVLDNNRSFQKRKQKRRYKHRPHIKALVEQEAQIIQRMEEIQEALEKLPDR